MSWPCFRQLGGRGGFAGGGLAVLLLLGVALAGGGCATGMKRDYNQFSYPPTEYFRVQFLLPEEEVSRPVPIESLLVLQPVGRMTEEQSRLLLLSIWQELQQNLPGTVRTPTVDGLFAPYVQSQNLMLDDGRIDELELERIGRLAGASHLLMTRVINYRAYAPQSIIMEWLLLDVKKKEKVLILAGSLDASEQKVQMAVGNYVRSRRANPQTTGSVGIVLNSPREFSRFAAAQAVDSLKTWLRPASDVYVPYLSF